MKWGDEFVSEGSEFAAKAQAGAIINHPDKVTMGRKLLFPAYGKDSLVSQVMFITGKRGSGKSWSAAVMMEEFDRLGLQFVCFDALGAHGNICQLDGVEAIRPEPGQSVDMGGLVTRLQSTNRSLIIDLSGLPLLKQQELIADYCEAMVEAKLGKGLMTIIEECQDYIPQMGRPISFDPIVRLCKLGRALGYGVALISQRPAGVNKEALSQASIYMVHNVINNRDLKTLDEQLSFGTDKRIIKKILDGISSARKGECVCYAPEFFRDRGYIVIDKVRGDRRTEHTGGNIDVRSIKNQLKTSEDDLTSFESFSSMDDLESFGHTKKPDALDLEPTAMPEVGDVEDSGFPEASPPESGSIGSFLKPDILDTEWDAETELPSMEYETQDVVTPDEGNRHHAVIAVTGVVLLSGLSYVVYRGLAR